MEYQVESDVDIADTCRLDVVESVPLREHLIKGDASYIFVNRSKFSMADVHRAAGLNRKLRDMMLDSGIVPMPLAAKTPDGKYVHFRSAQVRGLKRMTCIEKRLSVMDSSIYKPPVAGGIVNMDMGTGKTLMVLSLCASREKYTKNPSLILTNKGLIHTWKKQVETFFSEGSLRCMYIESNASYKKYETNSLVDFDIVITSYDHCGCTWRSLRQLGKYEQNLLPVVGSVPVVSDGCMLYSTDWERIVCDESQRICNAKTDISRSVLALASRLRWCTTGTLIRNGEPDLVSQLYFCGLDTMTCDGKAKPLDVQDLKHYIISVTQSEPKRPIPGLLKREKFKRSRDGDGDGEGEGESSTIAVGKKRRVHFDAPECKRMETTNFPELLLNCPPLEQLPQQVFLTDLIRRHWKDSSRRRNAFQYILKLRQCVLLPCLLSTWVKCNFPAVVRSKPDVIEWLADKSGTSGMFSPKMNKMSEIVRSTPESDKVVIFSEFHNVLEMARERLSQTDGFECRALEGTLCLSSRQTNLAEFESDPNVKVLLCTFKVGCEGHHLTAANHVIFLDMWWNYQVLNQAKTRCFREGQTKHVHYYPLVLKGSIESYMNLICSRKLNCASRWCNVERGNHLYEELLDGVFQRKPLSD